MEPAGQGRVLAAPRPSLALRLADRALAPFVYLAARLVRLVRRVTYARLPACAGMIDRVNIYPLIDYPYEPLFNLRRLTAPLCAYRDLPGVAIADEACLAHLAALGHRDELASLPQSAADPPAPHGFHFDNPFFRQGDAEVLYAVLRRHRPARLVEVGSGWSSRIAALALDRNAAGTGARARHLCIDPYVAFDAGSIGAEHLRQPVEACPPELFASLQAGDVLFIDSSHMIRPQGDVLYLVQRVLPRLRPGVWVHVHDIFTPADYADALMREHRIFWNEQYLLEAFLAGNADYEIVLPLHHLWRRHRAAFEAACPHLAVCPDALPTSFWMRRR